jgi:hypothetical protein
MGKSNWNKRTTQVVWEDLRPWVEQLWHGHGVIVQFHVYVTADETGLKPAIRLHAYRPRLRRSDDILQGRWDHFDSRTSGAAASVACRLAARLLLDLDEEKARAERATSF